MSFLRRPRGRSSDTGSDGQGDGASVYRGLRDHILTMDPASVGIRQTSDFPNVWGIVMDWGLERPWRPS